MKNQDKGQGVTDTAVASAEKNGFSLISNEKLIQLYSNLCGAACWSSAFRFCRKNRR